MGGRDNCLGVRSQSAWSTASAGTTETLTQQCGRREQLSVHLHRCAHTDASVINSKMEYEGLEGLPVLSMERLLWLRVLQILLDVWSPVQKCWVRPNEMISRSYLNGHQSIYVISRDRLMIKVNPSILFFCFVSVWSFVLPNPAMLLCNTKTPARCHHQALDFPDSRTTT